MLAERGISTAAKLRYMVSGTAGTGSALVMHRQMR
jgi:hypothetical protein